MADVENIGSRLNRLSVEADQFILKPQPQAASSLPDALLERVRDELTCCLCLDLMARPASLACGHSACRCCLNQLLSKGTPEAPARCPCCRTLVPGNMPPLSINSSLRSLAELLLPDECAERAEQPSPPLPRQPTLHQRVLLFSTFRRRTVSMHTATELTAAGSRAANAGLQAMLNVMEDRWPESAEAEAQAVLAAPSPHVVPGHFYPAAAPIRAAATPPRRVAAELAAAAQRFTPVPWSNGGAQEVTPVSRRRQRWEAAAPAAVPLAQEQPAPPALQEQVPPTPEADLPADSVAFGAPEPAMPAEPLEAGHEAEQAPAAGDDQPSAGQAQGAAADAPTFTAGVQGTPATRGRHRQVVRRRAAVLDASVAGPAEASPVRAGSATRRAFSVPRDRNGLPLWL